MVLLMPKVKSSLHKFWYWRKSAHFTWSKRLHFLLFLFTGYLTRWRPVGTRQVWFCLGQKRKVRYGSYNNNGTRHILLGLNDLNAFRFFLCALVRSELTVRTRKVWFCLGQKWTVRYASSNIKGTRCILLGVNGLTLFCFFLWAVVRGNER